ncbi:TetR/AcrR family transcriptional regulator [Pseudonocardia sp.]|uniref:TetR/AcrR family transcriptional regulator n=1 Tax=Pseudonocardia sp. TaxID=60912 RepID=UPI003D0BADBF
MRADAALNRRRVLAAAEEVFSERGTGASTEEVARRAGVGIGTVFRHFPTKRDLVAATLVAHLQELAAVAADLAGTADATTALHALLREMARTGPAKLSLFRHLLADGAGLPEAAATASAALRDGVAGLLHRAQAQGGVRPDVGVDEVYLLLRGLAQAQDALPADERVLARAVDVVLDGLSGSPRPSG